MNEALLAVVVFLPIVCSILMPLVPWKRERMMQLYAMAVVLITAGLVFFVLGNGSDTEVTLFSFAGGLRVCFHMDGLSRVFAALISCLWPLALLYSFEYMKHLSHRAMFFMFYVMTYGVTLGIAFSGNILTMYCFYEMLTLVTLPLIMHTLKREAILASRTYLLYSLGGAAFGFIGMLFIIRYGIADAFLPGGVILSPAIAGKEQVLLLVYVLTFFGFSVKAAMFPFGGWLPKAGVAPTPVTALLHAVAVVKAGAFAIIRLTYYCFGIEFLRGTWAQTFVMVFVIFTIVYGCARALKETHLKRRLAYSTMSNLSYILFGAVLMSPAGLIGALCHMVVHAVVKICAFFCVGAVMHQTDKEYVHQIDGFGRRMPFVFTFFTVCGLALMGVPGLAGFVSKWYLAKAAVENAHPLALVGVLALLVSAMLTSVYMLSISFRGFFPGKTFDYSTIEKVSDPNWKMLFPLGCFVVAVVVLGLNSRPLVDMLTQLASVM